MNQTAHPEGTGEPGLATTVAVPGRLVIGLATRASNAAERTADPGAGPIGLLWAEFMRRAYLQDLPHQAEPAEIVAVYTEYDSDQDGEYLAVLGRTVSSLAAVPDGMVGLSIPAQTMLAIPVDGDLQATIPATWERTLAMFAAGSPDRRTFVADLDIYPVEPSTDGPAGTILVGIHSSEAT